METAMNPTPPMNTILTIPVEYNLCNDENKNAILYAEKIVLNQILIAHINASLDLKLMPSKETKIAFEEIDNRLQEFTQNNFEYVDRPLAILQDRSGISKGRFCA